MADLIMVNQSTPFAYRSLHADETISSFYFT